MGNELVTVSPNATTITGRSGKVYRKSESLSFARYGMMEKLNVELSYGRTVHEMFQAMKESFELLNNPKGGVADAAVKIHYAMMGIARIADGRDHPAASLCMLFWNTEDEDQGTITPEDLSAKVDDVSHIDVAFFFGQAVSNVPGLLAAYREITGASSPDEERSENGSKEAAPALDPNA